MDKKTLEEVSEKAVATVREMIAKDKKLDWSNELRDGETTLREMIGTDDGAKEFVEKTTYAMYAGREAIPLLYKGLYYLRSDSSLPKTLTEMEMGPVSVVFLEKLEGGEVKFGTLEAGEEVTVNLKTFAAGIEYSEDIVEYNQFWRVDDIGAAFGESYNKLLNHMHLYPIIDGTYVTTGANVAAQKVAQEDDETAQLIAFDTDIETTLRNAITVLPAGTIILANSADRFRLEDAIFGSLYSDDKTPTAVRRQISPSDIIYYDGEDVTVGGKEYEYGGATAGTIHLIAPDKKNFGEYVKHDLRVDSGDGDLSRLIVTQVVGRARRGLLVVVGGKKGAVEVAIE